MPTVSDCRVSQVVNIKKGIHCLNPKDDGDSEASRSARPRRRRSYYVTHAKDADLNKAMDDASMGHDQVARGEGLARLDAYGLASVAMDCRVGDMSDAEKNVHCLMPKSLWQAPR